MQTKIENAHIFVGFVVKTSYLSTVRDISLGGVLNLVYLSHRDVPFFRVSFLPIFS